MSRLLKGDNMIKNKVRYKMKGEVMDLIIDELIKEVCSDEGIYIRFTDQMIRDNIVECYKLDRLVVINGLKAIDHIRNKVVILVNYAKDGMN